MAKKASAPLASRSEAEAPAPSTSSSLASFEEAAKASEHRYFLHPEPMAKSVRTFR